MILDPILESMNVLEDCDSTEDMLWAVDQANEKLKLNPPKQGDFSIFSMDAEALYPSLHLEDIMEGIMDIIMKTNIEFKNVNTEEMLKFIAIVYDNDELTKYNLDTVIPKRQVEINGTIRMKPMLAY